MYKYSQLASSVRLDNNTINYENYEKLSEIALICLHLENFREYTNFPKQDWLN